MGGTASSRLRTPALADEPARAPAEARETGGVTTRLILDYVERERGRDAVDRLLEICGCADREHLLRDENHWSSFETKVAMLEAAAEVLEDPLAARHIGQAGMDFNVAPGLKLSLRALGTVGLLYRNIPRTCAKFSTTHRMEALEVGRHSARIAYIHASDKGYHRADAEADANKRLATSLQDLVSDLRIDEVLAKITRNAQVAVHGKDFVLLVDEGGQMRCRSSSTIPVHAIAALEDWAASEDGLGR